MEPKYCSQYCSHLGKLEAGVRYASAVVDADGQGRRIYVHLGGGGRAGWLRNEHCPCTAADFARWEAYAAEDAAMVSEEAI